MVLELKGVCVTFPVYGSSSVSLKRSIVAAATGGRIGANGGVARVKALEGINLTLQAGDRLGVLGHNGSGKSTLLRVLAGVYPPTKGAVRRVGSVSSLIDPGLGIEPEATGEENILLRGLVMGLPRSEIRRVFDDVCRFSGLGNYLSLPVRTYSTGMLMRLAFAIATSIRSDIVLMDEWLSVGDADFQVSAEKRLKDLAGSASILVLATHSRALVERECNCVLVLEHGAIADLQRLA